MRAWIDVRAAGAVMLVAAQRDRAHIVRLFEPDICDLSCLLTYIRWPCKMPCTVPKHRAKAQCACRFYELHNTAFPKRRRGEVG